MIERGTPRRTCSTGDPGSRAILTSSLQRRRFKREAIQCRARIQIGLRHYAGYLHDISRGGAKLRTITPIRRLGNVILRLPDLPPLRCQLEWTDSYNAGLSFELALSASELSAWTKSRQSEGCFGLPPEALIDELAEVLCA